MELPFAEDVKHYWKTGSSSPDTWMDKTKKQIEEVGGYVTAEGFGSVEGSAAYMLAFEIDNENYKVIFPVLPTRSGKSINAKRQAATMLYHDIKAKCMVASVLGSRVAFFSYLQLEDGRVLSSVANPELTQKLPIMIPEKLRNIDKNTR